MGAASVIGARDGGHTSSVSLDLTRYAALSFDCYGTLIDWETGILGVLRPWADECGLDVDDEQLLRAYGDAESAVEHERPIGPVSDDSGRGLPDRGPFARWCGRRAVGGAARGVGARLARIRGLERRAERVGSALRVDHRVERAPSRLRRQQPAPAGHGSRRSSRPKMSVRTSRRTITSSPSSAPSTELGIERSRLLHVAQSLFHDHVPAASSRAFVGLDQPPARSARVGSDARADRRVLVRARVRLDGRVRRCRRCRLRRDGLTSRRAVTLAAIVA